MGIVRGRPEVPSGISPFGSRNDQASDSDDARGRCFQRSRRDPVGASKIDPAANIGTENRGILKKS